MSSPLGSHLARSLTFRSSDRRRPDRASRHKATGSRGGSKSDVPIISAPFPVDTPMPTTPAAMYNRQPLAKKPHKPVKRGLISQPVQLLSTTNELAYTSPDLKTLGMGPVEVGLGLSVPSSQSHSRSQSQSQPLSRSHSHHAPQVSAQRMQEALPAAAPQEKTSLLSEALANASASAATTSSRIASPTGSRQGEQERAQAFNHAYAKALPVTPFDSADPALGSSASSRRRQQQQPGFDARSGLHQRAPTPPLTRTGSDRGRALATPAGSVPSRNPSRAPSRARSQARSPPVQSNRSTMDSTSSEQSSRTFASRQNQRGSEASTASNAVPELSFTSSSATTEEHPFSKELAQVEEIAEEFKSITPELVHSPTISVVAAVPMAEDDEDGAWLTGRGLKAFRASEYLRELDDYPSSYSSSFEPFSAADQSTELAGGFF
ncbi:hypothetical protein KEM52_005710 [Ascosphaera acerosa]|nr:hypothetical protein KEM52_005710 [Ascosphaera acerosa]